MECWYLPRRYKADDAFVNYLLQKRRTGGDDGVGASQL